MTAIQLSLHEQSPHYQQALRTARTGMAILLLGLGGFFLWASLAPLDQGIVGSGTVVIAGEKKVVQPSLAGSIDELLVREGDNVQKGQVLLRLNTTRAQADFDVASGQWMSARSVEARLIAERLGYDAIAWPEDLSRYAHDPRAQAAMELQQGLFITRRAELASRLKILEHEAGSLQEQLLSFQDIRRHYATQLQFQQQELDGLRLLVKSGNVPRNQVYESERRAAQMGAQLAEAVSDVARTQQSGHEMALKSSQEVQAFRSAVESDLTQVAANVSALDERMKALDFELKNAALLAPVTGQVMGLSVHTQGGVVTVGQRLMDIVPQSSRWVIKAKFPPMMADRLSVGLPVDIRFGSLQRIKTPVLTGTVATVSADQLIDEHSSDPYFSVEVSVADAEVNLLSQAGLTVKPGMQAEVMVKTGERTLFNYLLRPVSERMVGALTEE
jgi:protease secretion system membrane fusion protein